MLWSVLMVMQSSQDPYLAFRVLHTNQVNCWVYPESTDQFCGLWVQLSFHLTAHTKQWSQSSARWLLFFILFLAILIAGNHLNCLLSQTLLQSRSLIICCNCVSFLSCNHYNCFHVQTSSRLISSIGCYDCVSFPCSWPLWSFTCANIVAIVCSNQHCCNQTLACNSSLLTGLLVCMHGHDWTACLWASLQLKHLFVIRTIIIAVKLVFSYQCNSHHDQREQ